MPLRFGPRHCGQSSARRRSGFVKRMTIAKIHNDVMVERAFITMFLFLGLFRSEMRLHDSTVPPAKGFVVEDCRKLRFSERGHPGRRVSASRGGKNPGSGLFEPAAPRMGALRLVCATRPRHIL